MNDFYRSPKLAQGLYLAPDMTLFFGRAHLLLDL